MTLLVPRIQDQVRVCLPQPALGKPLQLFIQLHVETANGGRGNLMAAEFLGNRLDLARGNPLHVHLSHRPDQGFFTALITLEDLRPKVTLPVLRHPQFQLPHPRDQRPAVISRTVVAPILRALPLLGAQRLIHLRLQDLLENLSNQRSQEILLLPHQLFPVRLLRAILLAGHLAFPFFPPPNGM